MIRNYIRRLYSVEAGQERWHQEYAGLSTDTKPTGPDIVTGSIFREVDTGLTYQYDEVSHGWTPKVSTPETQGSVQSLNAVPLAAGELVEVVGIPEYVSNPNDYPAYGLTETGWYVFARITGREGTHVSARTTVTGAAGYIAETGADHVDVAVRFETAPMGQRVTVNWGDYADSYVFRATDLAVRNLDYRTTFYVYDIAPYTTWEYALTTDATFVADKAYYTLDNGVYTLAEVTTGEAVPADTYYNHSRVIFEGMPRNVTYSLDTPIDCPLAFVLPQIEEDGHGAWFEIQMWYTGSFSSELLPLDSAIKVGNTTTQSQTAGLNTVDLHYNNVKKVWTLLNTHTNLPTT